MPCSPTLPKNPRVHFSSHPLWKLQLEPSTSRAPSRRSSLLGRRGSTAVIWPAAGRRFCGSVFPVPFGVFFKPEECEATQGWQRWHPLRRGDISFCACAVTEVNQPSSPLPLPLPLVLLVNQKKFGWLPGKHLLKSDLLLQQP